tara:strand:- start:856 stop:2670 length:1815 start_codon:yes stop_codon:yes gene_type:complete
MASNKFKNLIILVIISIIISSFFVWEEINLAPSLKMTDNFPGTVYIENNYSHWNEILRFSYTILLPSILFFIYLILTKNCIFISKNDIQLNTKFRNGKNVNLFFFIFFCITLNFLFSNPQIHNLDTLHEGMRLTSWENYVFYKNFWESSFITVGWGQEFLKPILSNILFNEVSINRTRLILFFYKFVNQILLLILVYKVIFGQKFEKNIKDFLFTIFSVTILFLSNFNDSILSHREIPIIIFFILLWNILNYKNVIFFTILTGLLSSFSFVWSLDRGIFLNILMIIFLTFQIFNNNYKNFFVLLLSIIIGWLIIYLIFGYSELFYFLKNSLWIFSNIEYIYGLIHPTPFGENIGSSRAGKNIIILFFTLFFSIYFGCSKNKIFSNSNQIFLIFLFLISILSYKTALGRSDGPHLRAAMFFPYFTLSYIILINLGYYMEKKNSGINFKQILKYISLIIFLGFILKIIIIENKTLKSNFQIKLLKKYDNDFYLKESEIKLYGQIKKELKNEECVNNFSYDASLPYLISKPTCNKYYFIYSLGGKNIQEDYIKSLKTAKSQLIILKKNDIYINNSVKKLLPITFKYIIDNYYLYKEFEDYQILKKKM